jgi:hypothetical protein
VVTERGHAQPVEHGLQVNQSVGCSKAQRCERVDHLQSTMTSYSHSVSFVHQQKDALEFGRKRYRFALTCNQGDQPFSRIIGASPPPGNRVPVPKFPITRRNQALAEPSKRNSYLPATGSNAYGFWSWQSSTQTGN